MMMAPCRFHGQKNELDLYKNNRSCPTGGPSLPDGVSCLPRIQICSTYQNFSMSIGFYQVNDENEQVDR